MKAPLWFGLFAVIFLLLYAVAAAMERDSSAVLLRRAEQLRPAEDFTGAMADCNRALALDPHVVSALSLRGAARAEPGFTLWPPTHPPASSHLLN